MKGQLLKNSSLLFVVIVCSLMAGVALADKKHWFVVHDKDGICKLIEVETVPVPLKTLAGPLKTMEEAEKIKAKECPKGTWPASQQLRRDQEQAEPIRQHKQREEPQRQDLKQQQTPQQQLQAPQQEQQTEKMKGKAPESNEGAKPSGEQLKGKTQEKIEGAKSPEEKVKEKAKDPIPSDKKD